MSIIQNITYDPTSPGVFGTPFAVPVAPDAAGSFPAVVYTPVDPGGFGLQGAEFDISLGEESLTMGGETVTMGAEA